jgi:hypothetical protein
MITSDLPRGVGLGVVEEVDAAVVGLLHDLTGEIGVDLGSEGDPGAEGQCADLET